MRVCKACSPVDEMKKKSILTLWRMGRTEETENTKELLMRWNDRSPKESLRLRSACMACVGVGISLTLGVLVSCSGPQPLSRAIRKQDEQAYNTMMSGSKSSPRQAFFAQRAKEKGISIDEAERADMALSDSKNPFKARHDPIAVSRGAVIYKNECMACHGEHVDGRGPALPVPLDSLNFHKTGLRWDITMRGGAAGKWFKTIENGTSVDVKDDSGKIITIQMPSFKDRLAKEQMWLAVTYLQSLDTDIPKTNAP